MNILVDLDKYCIIIPAYNAEQTIGELIRQIQKRQPALSIIVIDDGSIDQTTTIVSNFKSVILRSHAVNCGKGAAIKTGINVAQQSGYTWAIFIDADLQHDPDKIDEFIKIREQTHVDMVLGCRMISGTAMPFHRRLSNIITSFVLSIRTGKRIHDSQCGYRLITLSNLNTAHYRNDGFQFESEFILKTVYSGHRYSEIGIPTIYHTTGSSINNIMDTLRFIKLFFSSYLWF